MLLLSSVTITIGFYSAIISLFVFFILGGFIFHYIKMKLLIELYRKLDKDQVTIIDQLEHFIIKTLGYTRKIQYGQVLHIGVECTKKCLSFHCREFKNSEIPCFKISSFSLDYIILYYLVNKKLVKTFGPKIFTSQLITSNDILYKKLEKLLA